MNFYLSTVDNILKKEQDNPSIGILLCKKKNNVVVEYALKDMSKPIGVSEYKLTDYLPKEFENSLPSTQDIESRIKACIDTTAEEEEIRRKAVQIMYDVGGFKKRCLY